jgi:phosphoglycolate phosphatase-like HAD superfamily hydrolase
MENHNVEAVLWDFDGVLINSNHIRNMGFEIVLKEYPSQQVDELMQYHKLNGGLSRYAKFRYFFEVIRNEEISESRISELASAFSKIMLQNLCNQALLIHETIGFVKKNADAIPMYIVSGSDQNELRHLCEYFKLTSYFKGIFGSPTPKTELVRNIIVQKNHTPGHCVLVGDSINDFEAANNNGLLFMAYNNDQLKGKTTYEIAIA